MLAQFQDRLSIESWKKGFLRAFSTATTIPHATAIPTVTTNRIAAPLTVVATSGNLGIGNIRPGVSINNRGTVAFAALAAGNHSSVFARTAGGELKDLRPDAGGVSGYGVQINDNDDVTFLVGPGISMTAIETP